MSKRKRGGQQQQMESNEVAAPTLGPARSHQPSAHGGHQQTARSRAAAVGAPSLRALESLIAQAFHQSQHSGALPSPPALIVDDAVFTVSPLASSTRAATHYSASVIKLCTAFNSRHFPLRVAEINAAAKAIKAAAGGGGKKQKIKAADGSVSVRVLQRGDANNNAEQQKSSSSSAAASSAAAAAPSVMEDIAAEDESDALADLPAPSSSSSVVPADSTTLPFGDVQAWATIVAAELTKLLAALPPAHPLHKRVTCDVPAADVSVRGAGFIDFVIQPDSAAAAVAASSSAAAASSSAVAASASVAASSASPSPPLDAAPLALANSFTFDSIGTISSVFKLKYGTPRQGTIAPSARGSLTLRHDIPASSLEGLEEYSHLWIVFVFHRNENKSFKPKIEPPRAGGRKLGVFATRSPHRLNPIGLSLVKLDRIDMKTKTIFLSSLDLIQGTPVIDIKPYHPSDVAPAGYTIASWMTEQAEVKPPFALVDVAEEALDQLRAMISANQLEFYTDYDSALAAIRESVSHDPRPIYVRERCAKEEIYGFRMDRMNVLYRVDDAQRKVEIVAVQFVDYKKIMEEQRAEEEEKNGASAAAASSSSSTAAASTSLPFLVDEELITKKFLQQRPKRTYEPAAAAASSSAGASAAFSSPPAAVAASSSSSSSDAAHL